jgi:hypothetical protein
MYSTPIHCSVARRPSRSVGQPQQRTQHRPVQGGTECQPVHARAQAPQLLDGLFGTEITTVSKPNRKPASAEVIAQKNSLPVSCCGRAAQAGGASFIAIM